MPYDEFKSQTDLYTSFRVPKLLAQLSATLSVAFGGLTSRAWHLMTPSAVENDASHHRIIYVYI